MTILLQNRQDNKIEVTELIPHESRFRRMSKKMSYFFDLIKEDSRYAKNTTSKGKYIPVFITATYRTQDDWKPYHISALIQNYKKYFTAGGKNARMPAQDFRYVWVAELQKRGVIHYHLAIWLPRFMKLRDIKPDSLGWWEHGFTNAQAIKKSVFAYLSKYMSKGLEPSYNADGSTFYRSFPKGCRVYGQGGLTRLQRVKTAYKMMPQWVKKIFKCDETPIYRVKGGFTDGKVEVISPFHVFSEKIGGYWNKIILYEKKWSVIEDKEYEIEWDSKERAGHPDTISKGIGYAITPDMPIWTKYLIEGMK